MSLDIDGNLNCKFFTFIYRFVNKHSVIKSVAYAPLNTAVDNINNVYLLFFYEKCEGLPVYTRVKYFINTSFNQDQSYHKYNSS